MRHLRLRLRSARDRPARGQRPARRARVDRRHVRGAAPARHRRRPAAPARRRRARLRGRVGRRRDRRPLGGDLRGRDRPPRPAGRGTPPCRRRPRRSRPRRRRTTRRASRPRRPGTPRSRWPSRPRRPRPTSGWWSRRTRPGRRSWCCRWPPGTGSSRSSRRPTCRRTSPCATRPRTAGTSAGRLSPSWPPTCSAGGPRWWRSSRGRSGRTSHAVSARPGLHRRGGVLGGGRRRAARRADPQPLHPAAPRDARRPSPPRSTGVDVPTLPLMAAPTVHECTFPVDVVVTWVDGRDPAWNQARLDRLAGAVRHGHDPRVERPGAVRLPRRAALLVPERPPVRAVGAPDPPGHRRPGAGAGWTRHTRRSRWSTTPRSCRRTRCRRSTRTRSSRRCTGCPTWPSTSSTSTTTSSSAGRSGRRRSSARPGWPRCGSPPTRSGSTRRPTRRRTSRRPGTTVGCSRTTFGAVVTDNLAHAPYPHRRSVLEEIERRFPSRGRGNGALAVPLRHRPVDAQLVRPALRAADRDGVRRPASDQSERAYINISNSDLEWQLKKALAARAGLPLPGRPPRPRPRPGAARPDPHRVHGDVLPCGRPVGARAN